MKIFVFVSSAVVCLTTVLLFALSATAADTYKISIRFSNGQVMTKQVDENTTGMDIKKFIATATSYQIGGQFLFKGEREITNSMTMSAAGVTEGDELTLKLGTAYNPAKKELAIGPILFVIILVIGTAGVGWALYVKYRKMEYR